MRHLLLAIPGLSASIAHFYQTANSTKKESTGQSLKSDIESRPLPRRGWLLVHFKGYLKMRCSISWVAFALLSVSAITGCQSGTVWDPVMLDALHVTSDPLPSGFYYYDAAMAPTPPSAFANSPSSRYGSGSTASPYSSGLPDGK